MHCKVKQAKQKRIAKLYVRIWLLRMRQTLNDQQGHHVKKLCWRETTQKKYTHIDMGEK